MSEVPQKMSFVDKMINKPAVPIGMLGFFTIAAIGIKRYRQYGKSNPTLYFSQLRVAAQGFVVGALALTVFWDIGKSMLASTSSSPPSSSQGK